jgi:hypothetical protein
MLKFSDKAKPSARQSGKTTGFNEIAWLPGSKLLGFLVMRRKK